MGKIFFLNRSILYMPASNERAFIKGMILPVDGIILDLEDAIGVSEKQYSRDLICKLITDNRNSFDQRRLVVRINSLKSPWGIEDLKEISRVNPDAILIPKVENKKDLQDVNALLPDKQKDIKLWAMIETSRGVLNSQEIAESVGSLEALVIGSNDLIKDLGAKHGVERLALLGSLNHVLLAARANNLLCFDGVHNAFKDLKGLHVSCLQGRELGFDGKTLIHPSQISKTNEVFSPSSDEISEARLYIEEFQKVQLEGNAIAVVNGQIVENLHVEIAKKLLITAEIIAIQNRLNNNENDKI